MNSEVLIIGGGVIGFSIARALHKKGVKDIVLVERGVCGMGSTNSAAGMLAPLSEAERDDDFFRFCVRSRNMYPEFAASLNDDTGIDVELDRSGTLHPIFSAPDSEAVLRSFDWQTKAGFQPEILSAAETLAAEPRLSPAVRESVFYADDWQVENRKLLAALRKYAELNSITFRERMPVDELIINGGKVSGASANGEIFTAACTILATGAWTSLIRFGSKTCPLDVEPVRGQMICFHPPQPTFRRVIFSEHGYIVPRKNGRLLVGSTVERSGFNAAVTDTASAVLHKAAAAIAPFLSEMEIVDKWAGLRPGSADGLPILGGIPGYDGVLAATAHYRNGILLAPLTGELLAEKVAGGNVSPYLEKFGASRFL